MSDERTFRRDERLWQAERAARGTSEPPTQGDPSAILQYELGVAVEERMDVAHALQIDYDPPVNAKEPGRVQHGQQIRERLTIEMRCTAHVDLSVVAVRFNAVDVARCDNTDMFADAHAQPLKPLLSFGWRISQATVRPYDPQS